MLTIITETNIDVDPTRIYIKNKGEQWRVYAWPILPAGLELGNEDGYPITNPMSKQDAMTLYNRIADQVAAGVKVIDLRKMINEEGEAK